MLCPLIVFLTNLLSQYCRVTAVYDAVYRVYFYAAADKIGMIILFLSGCIGHLRLRQVETLICCDEIHHERNMLSISAFSGQV